MSSRSTRMVPAAAAGALCIGVAVLLGWAFDVASLRLLTPFDDQPQIKVNTAICLAVSAASLLLLRPEAASPGRRRVGRVLGALVGSIGAVTLAQHALNLDFGIDQLLVREQSVDVSRTSHPGRMAVNTATAFVLVGTALMAFEARWRTLRVANLLAGGAACLGLMAIDGIVLDVRDVAFFSQYANMAFATALAFVLLGIAVVGARADTGTMRLLTGSGSTSVVAQRLLPLMIVLPPVLGFLRLEGQQRGAFGLEFGVWIMVVGMSVMFAVVAWFLIDRLGATEARAREHEQRRDLAMREVVRANGAKSEFISRMSHELRTPLNSILGFGQLLQINGLRNDQAESVEHVMRAGRQLLALVNEVLDVERIEAGKMSVSVESVNVGDVVARALSSVAPLASARGCQLGDVQGDGTFVRADQQRVMQVLLNLLSNAIKYGGGVVQVEVAAETDWVRIDVCDNGEVEAADLARMFAPFERLRAEHGNEEGTGLGLALCERLVTLMGGWITVTSDRERGTCFSVVLPRGEPVTAAEPGQPEPATDGEQIASTSDWERLRVLYVDDNQANLELVRAVVARREGQMLSAMRGGAGVELAKAECPDVIVLDLHLPDISGHEVLRMLRAEPSTREIPVVMLTADASATTRRRAQKHGADGFLTKPLDIEQFVATLDQFVHAPA